ncbi:hypothetical protein BDAP_001706 [Binucleata daphniae]
MKHQENYKKEFNENTVDKEIYHIGQEVWIRNEQKQTKMDDNFLKKGTITEYEGNGIYIIKKDDKKQIRRHITQLRAVLERDVVLEVLEHK